MMRIFFFCLFAFPFICLGQSSGKLWVETGIKGNIGKKMDWGFQVTNRLGDDGLETNFLQGSFRYKACKYFRTSLDYRAIFDKDDYGNYTFSNRLNLNGDFRIPIKRLTISSRARYQFGFSGFQSQTYDSEFDQAVRIKPEISYNFKKFFINPSVSVDLFFDPTTSAQYNSFVRYRLYAGGSFNLKGPHEIEAGYILDQQVNVAPLKRRHIATLSYTYNLGAVKKKKEKKKS